MKNKNRPHQYKNNHKKGQVLVVFAILLPVVVLYCALGIDAGLMYQTKAKLSRSVDATALRVVDRYEPDIGRLRQLALLTMQANSPAFMNQTPAPEWVLTTEDGTDVHTLEGAKGEELVMTIRADDASNVITTTMKAKVEHKPYFLGSLGYDTISFRANATAERFPACNVLILDLSGSMRGNRAENLVLGVKAFVNEFVDDRDFMAVVAFSTVAKVIFPDVPDTNGRFLPTQNFQSGLSGDSSRSVSAIMDNKIRFAGATNAAEGMRVAFEQVDAFLANFTEAEREQIKVHYVFFTDGAFNTFRGFARGVGYGIQPGPDAGSPKSGAVYDVGQLNPTDDLPAFHNVKPLLTSSFYSTTAFQHPNGDSIKFTGFSDSPDTEYDLETLVGDVNIIDPAQSATVPTSANASLPGINAIVQGYRLKNAQWREMVDDDDIEDGRDGSKSNFPDDWDYMLYTMNSTTKVKTPLTEAIVQAAIEDAGGTYHDEWKYMVAREWFKLKEDHTIYYPVAYPSSWDPSNSSQKQDEFNEYFPGGRAFANVRSRITADTSILNSFNDTQLDSLHEDAVYFERNGEGLGPEDGVTGNYESWNYGTERLSDHYPYYTFGGDFDYPPIDHNSDGSDLEDKFEDGDNANWKYIGPPWEFYSFRLGEWTNAEDNSEGRITDEGDWTAEAQAYIARVQHDARIFTIRLGGGNANVGRRMANHEKDNAEGEEEPYDVYTHQPVGKYYETSDPDELVDIFRDIARKITVRLAE